MADFLAKTQNDIAKRIAALEPAVAEHQRLQEAAKALSQLNGAAATVAAPRRRGRPPGSGKRASAKAAPARKAETAPKKRNRGGRPKGSGTRSVQALELIQQQPGITIAEMAGKMGISKTYLYRVLPGLQKDGKVKSEGRGWHPK